ncbi:hypothetical protein [Mucilaginibacter sp.]|uniref:hypothetical protein n=1 Tax=Mucilaginibacter sp. TaxID=1882438 RepID=UPI00261A84F9|nr:hypothetical protein [Mucilaginibacter sp.]MDB5032292.1 hypothetical protein [Mucilaginibacter sp.]
METLIINVPETKVALVKLLFKELGIIIQNKTKVQLLAEKIDKSIKPGPKPTMDEIVAEVREVRASSPKKPSDFFGILNREEGEKFDKHIKRMRR